MTIPDSNEARVGKHGMHAAAQSAQSALSAASLSGRGTAQPAHGRKAVAETVSECDGESDDGKTALGVADASEQIARSVNQGKGISGKAKAAIVAALVLALGGGGAAYALQSGLISLGKSQDAPAAQAPAEKAVVSKVDGAMVFYKYADRDTLLTVTGEDGRYYTAELGTQTVLVEKKWVRLSSEAQSSAWKGYASDGVQLYKSAFLIGTPAATLPENAEVEVLDGKDDWLYVKTADGVTGFTRTGSFKTESEKRAEGEADEAAKREDDEVVEEAAPAQNDSWSGGYSYDWSGSDDSDAGSYDDGGDSGSNAGSDDSGGSSGDTGNTGGSNETGSGSDSGSTSGDGGDIDMGAMSDEKAPRLALVETAYAAEGSSAASEKQYGEGVVLSPGVALYLAKLDRGDAVLQADPTAKGGDFVDTVPVKVKGEDGTVVRALVRLEDDARFTPIDTYAQAGAILYVDYTLETHLRECAEGTALRAVDEYGDNYVIEGKGVFCYIPKASVSLKNPKAVEKNELKQEKAEAEAESNDDSSSDEEESYVVGSYTPDYGYYDDGGYDEGDSDDGGSSGGEDTGSSDNSGDAGGSSGSNDASAAAGDSASGEGSGAASGGEWTEPVL